MTNALQHFWVRYRLYIVASETYNLEFGMTFQGIRDLGTCITSKKTL